jgi:hypothetical protein
MTILLVLYTIYHSKIIQYFFVIEVKGHPNNFHTSEVDSMPSIQSQVDFIYGEHIANVRTKERKMEYHSNEINIIVRKRHRRTAAQIERSFKCPLESQCSRAYGSEAALKMHIKIKHPDYVPGISYKKTHLYEWCNDIFFDCTLSTCVPKIFFWIVK